MRHRQPDRKTTARSALPRLIAFGGADLFSAPGGGFVEYCGTVDHLPCRPAITFYARSERSGCGQVSPRLAFGGDAGLPLSAPRHPYLSGQVSLRLSMPSAASGYSLFPALPANHRPDSPVVSHLRIIPEDRSSGWLIPGDRERPREAKEGPSKERVAAPVAGTEYSAVVGREAGIVS